MAELRVQILGASQGAPRLRFDGGGVRWTAALRVAYPALVCLTLALATIALQGFRFGVSNNVFHIPIVLRWYDLPQFANDAFIQSLRRFATPVFPFLSLFTDSGNIALVFAIAHVLSRALAFYAVLQLVKALGLRGSTAWIALGAVTVCATLYSDSPVGKDDLLPDYFTHTELAQALALLGLAWLIAGKPLKACLAIGAAFDLNVVLGIWAVVPTGLIILFGTSQPWMTRLRMALAGAAVFITIALPEAIWLLHDQRLASPPFDYRAFLIEYYPYHFFIGWANWSERLSLAEQILCGLLAATLVAQHRRKAGLALLGFTAVFAAGIVVDKYTHVRFILNLHLLRVDGMILWVAIPLVATSAASALAEKRLLPTPAALATLIGLAYGTWPLAIPGLLALIVLRRVAKPAPAAPRDPAPARLTWASPIAAIFAIGGAAILVGVRSHPPGPAWPDTPPRDEQLTGAWPAAPQWRTLTSWARTSTPAGAVFLVPQGLDFVEAAERRSWVGWKEGASVMWAPDTYGAWEQRREEIKRLQNAGSVLAYACAHGIDYVIFDRRPQAKPPFARQPGGDSVFANRWFFAVKPSCHAGAARSRSSPSLASLAGGDAAASRQPAPPQFRIQRP